MDFENEEVDRITIQLKGGIKETKGSFHIGDKVTLLVEAQVTSIEYKVDRRSGHLVRHHTLAYDSAEAVRKNK